MSVEVLPLYKESLAVENYTQLNIEVLEGKALELETMSRRTDLLPRQKQEINRILGHLVFEIAMRKGDDS